MMFALLICPVKCEQMYAAINFDTVILFSADGFDKVDQSETLSFVVCFLVSRMSDQPLNSSFPQSVLL